MSLFRLRVEQASRLWLSVSCVERASRPFVGTSVVVGTALRFMNCLSASSGLAKAEGGVMEAGVAARVPRASSSEVGTAGPSRPHLAPAYG